MSWVEKTVWLSFLQCSELVQLSVCVASKAFHGRWREGERAGGRECKLSCGMATECKVLRQQSCRDETKIGTHTNRNTESEYPWCTFFSVSGWSDVNSHTGRVWLPDSSVLALSSSKQSLHIRPVPHRSYVHTLACSPFQFAMTDV